MSEVFGITGVRVDMSLLSDIFESQIYPLLFHLPATYAFPSYQPPKPPLDSLETICYPHPLDTHILRDLPHTQRAARTLLH